MNWISPNDFARRTMANPTLTAASASVAGGSPAGAVAPARAVAAAPARAVAAPLGVTLGDPRRPVVPRRAALPGPEGPRGPQASSVAGGHTDVRGCLTEGIAKCKDLHESGELDTNQAAQCITGMYKGCQKGGRGQGLSLTNNPIVNAARAIGRLATGTPNLRRRAVASRVAAPTSPRTPCPPGWEKIGDTPGGGGKICWPKPGTPVIGRY